MKRTLIVFMIAILFAVGAQASTLEFPEDLTEIQAYAFQGDTSIEEVVLPEKIEKIGSYAFADSSVTRMYLPDSLTSIAKTAFSNCTNLVCWGNAGTYGASFCKKNGIRYETKGKLRALLIGETDYTVRLNGPDNDVACMDTVLTGLGYSTTVQMEATLEEIYDLVDIAFSGATESDTSLFFYSGHGITGSTQYYSGALQTVDYQYISTQDLAELLSGIPGKVIVILDSCGSGSAISDETVTLQAAYAQAETEGPDAAQTESTEAVTAQEEFNPSRFNAGVINAFRRHDSAITHEEPLPDNATSQSKAGELRQTKFYVLTGSAYEENSETVLEDGVWGGVFTRGVASGLGCSYPGGTYSGSMPADTNSDNCITFLELAGYCRNYASETQNVQSYSATPHYAIFTR